MNSILRFRINYETQFGNNVYITGNISALGNWDLKKAIKLNWK